MPDDTTKLLVDVGDLRGGVTLRSGVRTTIQLLEEPPVGNLSVVIFDYRTRTILPMRPYRAQGHGITLNGSTDEHGFFLHERVPAGYYTLTIDDRHYLVPTVASRDNPHHQWVIRKDVPNRDSRESDRICENICKEPVDRHPEPSGDRETG